MKQKSTLVFTKTFSGKKQWTFTATCATEYC